MAARAGKKERALRQQARNSTAEIEVVATAEYDRARSSKLEIKNQGQINSSMLRFIQRTIHQSTKPTIGPLQHQPIIRPTIRRSIYPIVSLFNHSLVHSMYNTCFDPFGSRTIPPSNTVLLSPSTKFLPLQTFSSVHRTSHLILHQTSPPSIQHSINSSTASSISLPELQFRKEGRVGARHSQGSQMIVQEGSIGCTLRRNCRSNFFNYLCRSWTNVTGGEKVGLSNHR